jgi:hypothetical protein
LVQHTKTGKMYQKHKIHQMAPNNPKYRKRPNRHKRPVFNNMSWPPY